MPRGYFFGEFEITEDTLSLGGQRCHAFATSGPRADQHETAAAIAGGERSAALPTARCSLSHTAASSARDG